MQSTEKESLTTTSSRVQTLTLPLSEPAPNTLVLAQKSLNFSFYKDIAYGNDPRQRFDLFLPDNIDHPVPLVVYFHGGGFDSGDKSEAYTTGKTYENLAKQVEDYLAAGFAVASTNYRLLSNTGKTPLDRGVLRSLKDCQQMVQFVRLHQKELGIQSNKIALHGTSAGAGAALWLGFLPDQALPESTEPLLRQSTQVTAVAANEVQGSYDMQQWENVIFKPYGVTLSQFLQGPLANSFLRFYGISSASEFTSEPLKNYRKKVDLLKLMQSDSAPFRVSNQQEPLAPPTTTYALLHHVFHGWALHEKAQAVGLEHDANLPALGVVPRFSTSADFLIDALNRLP